MDDQRRSRSLLVTLPLLLSCILASEAHATCGDYLVVPGVIVPGEQGAMHEFGSLSIHESGLQPAQQAPAERPCSGPHCSGVPPQVPLIPVIQIKHVEQSACLLTFHLDHQCPVIALPNDGPAACAVDCAQDIFRPPRAALLN